MTSLKVEIICSAVLLFGVWGCASKPPESAPQRVATPPASADIAVRTPAASDPTEPANVNPPAPTTAVDQSQGVVRLQPLVYGASNELVGFRIYPGRQRQKFFCLGLQAGDLLQSIDNLMIKGLLPSPQEMEMLELRIVQSFASERRMALQIKRGPPNGEAVELNFLTSDNCGA